MSNAPRSLLFVPGNRPERFAKALSAGADLVCIDLEDAVPPEQKAEARAATISYLRDAPTHVGVRLNAPSVQFGLEDAAAFLAEGVQPGFVMLPKVDHEETVRLLAAWFAQAVHIVPIIETARGLVNAASILAEPRVQCAVFGGVDYAAEVGCSLDWEGLTMPRSVLANAAAQSDVTLLDVPYIDVRDLEGLEAETRRTRNLGLRARAAIHPAQIEAIHRAFAPTAEEVLQAQRVMDAFDASDGAAALLDGKVIELPVIKAARRVLAQRGS